MQVIITLHFRDTCVSAPPFPSLPSNTTHRMARYRNVMFTINNPEEATTFDEGLMHYLVYQEEIGEEGTYHFQGYCELKNQTRMAALKRLLGGERNVHLETRRGTQEQAIAYCKKEESRIDGPYEFGQPRSQGKRMDLEAFKDEVMAGKRKRDLVDDHVGVIARYPKFYDTLMQMNRPERTTELEVSLLIGETGTGKTRSVYDQYHGENELFMTPLNNGTMWWDGYDRHKIVLLDDFSGAACHMTLTTLLRLLDRYPISVPIKGSYTWWLPDKVFVTTNILPKHWFKWENRLEQYKALARRFHKVITYKANTEPEEETPQWWEDNAPTPYTYPYADIAN